MNSVFGIGLTPPAVYATGFSPLPLDEFTQILCYLFDNAVTAVVTSTSGLCNIMKHLCAVVCPKNEETGSVTIFITMFKHSRYRLV